MRWGIVLLTTVQALSTAMAGDVAYGPLDGSQPVDPDACGHIAREGCENTAKRVTFSGSTGQMSSSSPGGVDSKILDDDANPIRYGVFGLARPTELQRDRGSVECTLCLRSASVGSLVMRLRR